VKRIYLAAPFEQIDKMKAYAQQLRALGFEVTSRWLDEQNLGDETDLTDAEGGTKLETDADTAFAISNAVRDIRNILVSDTVIEFNPGKALVRNTRLAEFGGALFLGKQCVVIGPENPKHKSRIDTIFSLLSEGSIPDDLAAAGIKPVKHFDTWGAFLEYAVMESAKVVKKNDAASAARPND
jgi:hypothetical protein